MEGYRRLFPIKKYVIQVRLSQWQLYNRCIHRIISNDGDTWLCTLCIYNSSKYQPNNVKSVNLLSQFFCSSLAGDSNPCYWDTVTPNRLHCSRPARPHDHLSFTRVVYYIYIYKRLGTGLHSAFSYNIYIYIIETADNIVNKQNVFETLWYGYSANKYSRRVYLFTGFNITKLQTNLHKDFV